MARKRKTAGRSRRLAQTPAAATTLRVIGGRLRGQQFVYHGDPTTRPMKQRVREAGFNLIGPRVRGTHVIDLFAGTGALAWEALSRGASSATLIERHFPTARQINQNATALAVADRVEVVTGDTFFWAHHHLPNVADMQRSQPWLTFCSPPYDLFVDQRDATLELIETIIRAAPQNSLMLVESDERFDTDLLSNLMEWDVRRYAPAVLAVGAQPSTAETSLRRSDNP